MSHPVGSWGNGTRARGFRQKAERSPTERQGQQEAGRPDYGGKRRWQQEARAGNRGRNTAECTGASGCALLPGGLFILPSRVPASQVQTLPGAQHPFWVGLVLPPTCLCHSSHLSLHIPLCFQRGISSALKPLFPLPSTHPHTYSS